MKVSKFCQVSNSLWFIGMIERSADPEFTSENFASSGLGCCLGVMYILAARSLSE